MKQSSKLLAGLAASVLVFAAQAGGVKATEVPRITNGGTGVIGGVDPAAYPRQQMNQPAPMAHNWHGASVSSEASGMVNGRRAMPQAQAQSTRDTARMGAGPARSGEGLAPRHQAWGTPD